MVAAAVRLGISLSLDVADVRPECRIITCCLPHVLTVVMGLLLEQARDTLLLLELLELSPCRLHVPLLAEKS